MCVCVGGGCLQDNLDHVIMSQTSSCVILSMWGLEPTLIMWANLDHVILIMWANLDHVILIMWANLDHVILIMWSESSYNLDRHYLQLCSGKNPFHASTKTPAGTACGHVALYLACLTQSWGHGGIVFQLCLMKISATLSSRLPVKNYLQRRVVRWVTLLTKPKRLPHCQRCTHPALLEYGVT